MEKIILGIVTCVMIVAYIIIHESVEGKDIKQNSKKVKLLPAVLSLIGILLALLSIVVGALELSFT